MPRQPKMKEMLLKNLAQVLCVEAESAIEARVTGITTDSRTAQPGDCFFAIKGENFDGHDYVTKTFGKGAICAVVQKDLPDAPGPILKVPDTIKALGQLAHWYRRNINFKVIAVTGSVGKTTTRKIIAHVLAAHFPVFEAPKNFNNEIGLPLTLLSAEPQHKIVVAEIGSNHPGEIEYLAKIAEPDIALITNVYQAHLAGFSDLRAIIKEKSSISLGLRKNGLMIVNGRFESLNICRRSNMDFTTFGQSDNCDIKPQNITYTESGSTFTIDGSPLELPLPGPGNIENALAAWAVCKHLDIAIEDFAKALKTIEPVPMRAHLRKIDTLTVIDDCYNANPASMKNALQILTHLAKDRANCRLVFICGDMAELGDQTNQLHAELGKHIADANVDLLLTVGKAVRLAARTAQKLAQKNLSIKSFDNAADACNNLKEFIRNYDIILVKGSRAAALKTVVEKLYQLFKPRANAKSTHVRDSK